MYVLIYHTHICVLCFALMTRIMMESFHGVRFHKLRCNSQGSWHKSKSLWVNISWYIRCYPANHIIISYIYWRKTDRRGNGLPYWLEVFLSLRGGHKKENNYRGCLWDGQFLTKTSWNEKKKFQYSRSWKITTFLFFFYDHPPPPLVRPILVNTTEKLKKINVDRPSRHNFSSNISLISCHINK